MDAATLQSRSLSLPEPTLCAPLREHSVHLGERVIVHLLAGEKVAGALKTLDLATGSITVDILGASGPRKMAFEACKSIQWPKLRTWVPGRFSTGAMAPPARLHDVRQQFRILFVDGDSLEGETIGVGGSPHGFFLFPLQSDTAFVYTLIPKKAIAEYNIGPRLGEVLIEGNQVTQQEVEIVAADQKKSRSQPLGEYFRTKAIVTALELERALERQKKVPNMRLGEVLVSEKLIDEEQLQNALNAQKLNRTKQLGHMLVDRGLVSAEQIQQALAKKLGIAYVDVSRFQPDAEAIALVSREIIIEQKLLPLHVFDGKIVVAVENPLDSHALEMVRFQSNLVVEPVMASGEQIDQAIQALIESPAGAALRMADLEDDMRATAIGEHQETASDLPEASDNVVVKLVNMLVVDAYHKDASDIHIEPYSAEGNTQIRIRKDGSLIQHYEVPAKLRFALVSRIKIMAGLDIAERRKPQDGKIDFKRFGPLRVELRVATLPTAGGQEDVVMRILSSGKPMPLDQLALSQDNLDRLKRLVTKPHGLFFVCGPTGSGKTTTLHSVLSHLNTSDRKIWTVEDPVEITQKGLRQVQVNTKIGLNFAMAMRAFLRADPDIIMVGEMRDEETAQMGVEASLTGHLVLSTLHTNSAAESIVRLLDMGMNPFNFTDALIGVLSQRLAKRLCTDCVERYTATDEEIETLLAEHGYDASTLGGAATGLSDRAASTSPREGGSAAAGGGTGEGAGTVEGIRARWNRLYADPAGAFTLGRATGCERCNHTGYRGRVGIHELLSASDEIKRRILAGATVKEMAGVAISEGMRTLKQDGIEKVLMGLTDIHQIRKVSQS